MPVDPRYVYGANCTWHAPIAEVSNTIKFAQEFNRAHPETPMDVPAIALPCCPQCGGMLFEYANIGKWNENSAKFCSKVDWVKPEIYKKWIETIKTPCKPLRSWDWVSDYKAFAQSLEAETKEEPKDASSERGGSETGS